VVITVRQIYEVNAWKLPQLYDVPDSDIFLDHAGFDTYDSMIRAKSIFQADKAIVYPKVLHLPRAI
jgi:vancomycin permeability regulator SanA